MELRQLSSFVAVAESGRVSSAALRCHLTQGAVSQQLKLLEEELNVQLFIRTRKEMILTDSGEIFLEHARRTLQEAQEGKDAVLATSGKVCGDLRIGAGSFIEPFIGPAIAEFMKKYPDVRVGVQYDYAHVLNRQLRNHDLDIAFSINKSYVGEGILSTPSFRFTLQAIMQKGHPLSKKKSITFEDITRYSVALPEIGIRETETLKQYASEDILPMLVSARCDTNNVNSLLNCVENLGMVTMLPCEYVIKKENLISRPVKSISEKFVCYCHRMANSPMKASEKAFLDIFNSSSIIDLIR